MRTALLSALVILVTAFPAAAQDKAKPNTLTPKEIADGWILLFDGETSIGWKTRGEFAVGEWLAVGGKQKTAAVCTSTFPPLNVLSYEAYQTADGDSPVQLLMLS